MFEAYVYIWYDHNEKKYYIGSHKGLPDDSYCHSSVRMIRFTRNNIPKGFRERILAQGKHDEMLELEIKLLENRKVRCWNRYYNVLTSFPPPPMCGKDNPMYGRTGELNPMYGKPLSEETRRKISKAKIGKTHTEESKRKIGEAMRGKTLSEETRRKLSEAKIGKLNYMYGRTGELNPMYGKPRSEETRRKISKTMRGNCNKGKSKYKKTSPKQTLTNFFS